MSIHTDLEQAFREADVVLLLDEWWSGDSDEDSEGEQEEKKKKKVKEISERYTEYGQLIDARANKEVKVIVCGDSFVNLRCSLLVDNARSINSNQFVTMATQVENEARAIMAKKLRVKASGSHCELFHPYFYCILAPGEVLISPSSSTPDITDVIVWGNISGRFYIDLQRAKVFNYDGAIKGPAFFSQSLVKIFYDRFVSIRKRF